MVLNTSNLYPTIQSTYFWGDSPCIQYLNTRRSLCINSLSTTPNLTIAKIATITKLIFFSGLVLVALIPTFFVDLAITIHSCLVWSKANKTERIVNCIAIKSGNNYIYILIIIVIRNLVLGHLQRRNLEKKYARFTCAQLLNLCISQGPISSLSLTARVKRRMALLFFGKKFPPNPYLILTNLTFLAVSCTVGALFLSYSRATEIARMGFSTSIRTRSYSFAGKNRKIFNRQEFPHDTDIENFMTQLGPLNTSLGTIKIANMYTEKETTTIEEAKKILRQAQALDERIRYLNAQLPNKQAPPITAAEWLLSLNWTGLSVQHQIHFTARYTQLITQIKELTQTLIANDPNRELDDHWCDLNEIYSAMIPFGLHTDKTPTDYHQFRKEIACQLLLPHEFSNRCLTIGEIWLKTNQNNASYPEIPLILAKMGWGII